MSELFNDVLAEYWASFSSLSFDKKLHFASRLYLWNQDHRAQKELINLKADVLGHDDPAAALQSLYDQAMASPSFGSKNAAALREAYFRRYPHLKAYNTVLFRAVFMRNLYEVDSQELVLKMIPQAELEAQYQSLLKDDESVAILSTHAVNFMYLYDHFLLSHHSLSTDHFSHIARTKYDFSNLLHLQLFIYLLTHCIIGESQFYYLPIKQNQRETYTVMVRELEEVISEYYQNINLDNKCEFLVCCRMLGYVSALEQKIYDEAARSVSDKGCFIIDRHNNNPQVANTDIESSEHRNVLYIMSHFAYTPTGGSDSRP